MIDVRESLPALELDRLYTTCQLANVLGVSPKSVTRYRRHGVDVAGRLRAIRVGKVWRFAGGDVLAWLAAQQQVADGPVGQPPASVRRAVDLVDAQLDAEGF